ncbi:MAG TPA: acyl-CoA dehydrogenase family protein, partial [Fimbriimonadaceae bacterium]|nr:acyl-CoA dehydrogenase family protein [Fimbriimonadaceae bacterium]
MESIVSSPAAGCSFLTSTPERTFIPEDFAGDERLMIQAAEEFSRKEVLPLVERLEKQEEGLMPGLIRKAGELGFCGVDSPEAYGGLGLGKNLAARILEYLSLDASFSVTIGVTSGIGQVGLSLFGNEEQKAKYLPRLAAGEWIGAYALSEPNSGTDALSATTRAERRGDKWVLNGTKMWISNAKWADFFLVMAKIDGERFSAFLVERSFPGVKIEREEHKLGLKGSSTSRVTLEDVEVPIENLLHEEGLGHQVALNALNLGRFKLAAMCLGPARHAIELSSAYAQERRQFGQPIAQFGLIRQKFAEMAARFFAAEAMVYRTGALIDEAFQAYAGDVAGNRRAAEEFSVECSMCKVFASEAQDFIIDEALQVYGGYGFT